MDFTTPVIRNLDLVRLGAHMMRSGQQLRDTGILDARAAGHSWREIAEAAGMTQHGAIQAAKRAETGQ